MSSTALVVFVLLLWCFTGALVVGPQLLAFYLRAGRGRPGRTYGVVVATQLIALAVLVAVVAGVRGLDGTEGKVLAVAGIAAYVPLVLWVVPTLWRERRPGGRSSTAAGDPQLRTAVLLTVLPFAAVGVVGLCLPAFSLAFQG